MSKKNIAPVEDKVIVNQKKESLVALEKKAVELRKEIQTLENIKTNIDDFITKAYSKKDKELKEKTELLDEKEDKLNKDTQTLDNNIAKLEKDKKEFETLKEKADIDISQRLSSVENQEKKFKHKIDENNRERELLKHQQEAATILFREYVSNKNSLTKNISDLEKKKEVLKFRDIAITDRENAVKSKEASFENREVAVRNAEMSVDDKLDKIKKSYEELLKKEQSIEFLKETIKKDKLINVRTREDNVIFRKKNDIEAFKLKERERIVLSREDALNKKEKIFNQTIGG